MPKLMPAIEATKPADKRRALRFTAITDAWAKAGHYEHGGRLPEVRLAYLAIDAIEKADFETSENRCLRHGVGNCKRC